MSDIANVAAVPQYYAASYSLDLAEGFADTNLTDRIGYPNHAAQRIDVFNRSSLEETFNYTDWNGHLHSRPVAPETNYSVLVPVTSVQTSGANLRLTIYWWPASGFEINE